MTTNELTGLAAGLASALAGVSSARADHAMLMAIGEAALRGWQPQILMGEVLSPGRVLLSHDHTDDCAYLEISGGEFSYRVDAA